MPTGLGKSGGLDLHLHHKNHRSHVVASYCSKWARVNKFSLRPYIKSIKAFSALWDIIYFNSILDVKHVLCHIKAFDPVNFQWSEQ